MKVKSTLEENGSSGFDRGVKVICLYWPKYHVASWRKISFSLQYSSEAIGTKFSSKLALNTDHPARSFKTPHPLVFLLKTCATNNGLVTCVQNRRENLLGHVSREAVFAADLAHPGEVVNSLQRGQAQT